MLACTLCRSGRQSISTLERASQRKIEWPKVSSDPPNFKVDFCFVIWFLIYFCLDYPILFLPNNKAWMILLIEKAGAKSFGVF